MESDALDRPAGGSHERPEISLARETWPSTRSIGVFASSFNPVTIAHVSLVERAAKSALLGTVLALAGRTNADKPGYETSLEHRLEMMRLAFAKLPRVVAGVTTHPFFVDMVDAVFRNVAADTELSFIMGFDTFERVLDLDGKYLDRYARRFSTTAEAIDGLLTRSRLIVAGRGQARGEEVRRLADGLPPALKNRILHLDVADDLSEVSATEVRRLAAAAREFDHLVPSPVADYIKKNGLYKATREIPD